VGNTSYNSTVSATDSGICSLSLDDDVLSQVKNGLIYFEKIKNAPSANE
jgi:hypothetical protein